MRRCTCLVTCQGHLILSHAAKLKHWDTGMSSLGFAPLSSRHACVQQILQVQAAAGADVANALRLASDLHVILITI